MEKDVHVQVEMDIVDILVHEFPREIDSKKQLVNDTPLLGRGLGLDSLEVLSLVTQIEAKFGIEIDDEELNVRLFSTIGTLAERVVNKLSKNNTKGLGLGR